MSTRRSGNRIRGPQSALTDFLAANNISAAQIRDDFLRRTRQAELDANAGEGSAPAQAEAEEEAAEEAAQVAAQAEEDEQVQKTKKRKRDQKESIEKIKKSKASKSKKKGKKGDPDDDDDDDDDYDIAADMYRKSKPAPGQFENCELCEKRFTVTPYSKEGPDGGLLCGPCGKAHKKDLEKEKRAAAPKKPAGKQRRKLESDRLDGIAVGGAKSLKQLCIEKVVKHHQDVEELGDVPDSVLEKLSMIFSKKRVMTPKTLPLFLRPDLDSVNVHDAAYLNEEDYEQIFAVVPNMHTLGLSNACRFKDESVEYMLDRCKNLRHIQLYAANLVSDEMWQKLFIAYGPQLETIKLRWLDAAFDDASVEGMVINCPNLKRVKLTLCRRIGEDAVKSISRLTKLEHLTLQIGAEVAVEALVDLVQKTGAGLQTLSLDRFIDADDLLLSAIHDNCHKLSKLRISNNDSASDAGYVALFTEWNNPPLSYVDFNSTRDMDNNNPQGPEDPIGVASDGFRALMAHSGSNLRHLDIASCRHIRLAAFMDVFNGAQNYPNLEYINLSFCNRVDTSVIAGIFRSCPALKQLVAFGCFEIADVVVPRNIALIGVPKAQDAIEQFGVGIDVDEAIGRMAAEIMAQ